MFAWKQQIVDTFRGTCQVSIISTENPPKKSTGCRTHQGTSCTSQNRHLGHHLADATVWIWTREFKPTCLRYLDATIANHGGILATVYKHILVTLVLHLIFNFIWYCSSLIVFGYSRKIIYIPCWDQPLISATIYFASYLASLQHRGLEPTRSISSSNCLPAIPRLVTRVMVNLGELHPKWNCFITKIGNIGLTWFEWIGPSMDFWWIWFFDFTLELTKR